MNTGTLHEGPPSVAPRGQRGDLRSGARAPPLCCVREHALPAPESSAMNTSRLISENQHYPVRDKETKARNSRT